MSALPCARLHHPSRKTASIIHLGVERDTRALDLLPQQRLNCYPASPLVVLSWVFHGQLHMVQTPVDGGSPVLSEPLPGMLFAGPSRTPSISWSPGPVHAISIGLYPNALKRVFGIEASDFLDQVLPMEQVLPAASCQALGQAGTEEGPLFEQLEAAIHRCAHGCLSTEGAATLHHWLTALGMRMAATRTGTGLRQMQRQFKRWAGQSHVSCSCMCVPSVLLPWCSSRKILSGLMWRCKPGIATSLILAERSNGFRAFRLPSSPSA